MPESVDAVAVPRIPSRRTRRSHTLRILLPAVLAEARARVRRTEGT